MELGSILQARLLVVVARWLAQAVVASVAFVGGFAFLWDQFVAGQASYLVEALSKRHLAFAARCAWLASVPESFAEHRTAGWDASSEEVASWHSEASAGRIAEAFRAVPG